MVSGRGQLSESPTYTSFLTFAFPHLFSCHFDKFFSKLAKTRTSHFSLLTHIVFLTEYHPTYAKDSVYIGIWIKTRKTFLQNFVTDMERTQHQSVLHTKLVYWCISIESFRLRRIGAINIIIDLIRSIIVHIESPGLFFWKKIKNRNTDHSIGSQCNSGSVIVFQHNLKEIVRTLVPMITINRLRNPASQRIEIDLFIRMIINCPVD